MTFAKYAAALLLVSAHAAASPGKTYFVLESAPQQQIDVYNDGRSTFIAAVPGLVVPGATHDGDRYIIRGVPREMTAVLNGKSIVITQGVAPVAPARKPDALEARLNNLEKAEKALLAKIGATDKPALPLPTWEVRADDKTIQGAIVRWAKTANWQVVWDTPVDYPTKVSANFTGSFEDAADALLRAFRSAESPLHGCFYEGNKVFRVFRTADNKLECQ